MVVVGGGWKKICHAHMNPKKAGVNMLLAKVYSRAKGQGGFGDREREGKHIERGPSRSDCQSFIARDS